MTYRKFIRMITNVKDFSNRLESRYKETSFQSFIKDVYKKVYGLKCLQYDINILFLI